MSALLEVSDLRVAIRGGSRSLTLVDGVDLHVDAGEVLGIAGESGSGKTISMLSLFGLQPTGAAVTGDARFCGRDLFAKGARARARVRGRGMAMVLQNPMTALHPMLNIERQMTEHMRYHLGLRKGPARARALELLTQVRLPDPERALRSFPHEFSGGMRQRIAIASALACRPRLLVADEPTTALDTTVQSGILALLDELRRETGLAVVFITHDLGVIAAIADRLAVMYCGRVVERGTTREVIEAPRHPYTKGLLESLPDAKIPDQRVVAVPGSPAPPEARPSGCAFHPRCVHAVADCATAVPVLQPLGGGRALACPVDPWAA